MHNNNIEMKFVSNIINGILLYMSSDPSFENFVINLYISSYLIKVALMTSLCCKNEDC